MIHPLRVNGKSEWVLGGRYEYWAADERRPTADTGHYDTITFKLKKEAQAAVNRLNQTHSRGYDQGVYDLLMLLVDLGLMTKVNLEVVFKALTDSEPDQAVAREALREALGADTKAGYARGYQTGASDLLVALERQGRLLPASAGQPWTRGEILASLTAWCPNPWHQSARARATQTCPECPPDGVHQQ
jgi:hypothetical protein